MAFEKRINRIKRSMINVIDEYMQQAYEEAERQENERAVAVLTEEIERLEAEISKREEGEAKRSMILARNILYITKQSLSGVDYGFCNGESN